MSDEDSQVERLRDAFASRGSGKAPSADRVFDDAEVWAASRGELDSDRTRELLDLAARDPECAEAWRLARAMRRESGRSSASGKRRLAWVAAAAAVVALALLATPRLLRDGSSVPDEPVLRAGETYAIESELPADRPLPRAELVLEWTEGPAETIYSVEVATIDLEVLHSARRLSQPRHHVPPDALDDVPDGATLLWRVEALRPDGSRVRSPTFRVTVE